MSRWIIEKSLKFKTKGIQSKLAARNAQTAPGTNQSPIRGLDGTPIYRLDVYGVGISHWKALVRWAYSDYSSIELFEEVMDFRAGVDGHHK